jgi:hypothetical protein
MRQNKNEYGGRNIFFLGLGKVEDRKINLRFKKPMTLTSLSHLEY